ncbi:Fasciclin-domain-containing protein [Corynespora cassiicola Philippines]|uniref:Fasciclin-domain-containing protein n=1 Tax=Corynespora cassiicola Philippines TaxID=1448308 RepID=A0A2T2NN25_CORCC|nr:Fasciclin-domain-containing protein [Corynespora cassiicola Philippines]
MHLKNLAPVALLGLASAQDNGTASSLNATLAGNPNLSNLTTFLSAAPQLLQTLDQAQNITILAPSNSAFEALANSSILEQAASDPGLLAALLTYHVLNGTFTAEQITNTSAFVPTLLTDSQYSNVTGGQVVEAVRIGEEVVFFSGLLQNSTVSEADLNFTGGVIHVVDAVLTLPLDVLETASAANLTSLRGAVNATDLVSVVNDTPDLTIFAPNNEAFNAIGSALSELSNNTEALASILAYHVINGTVGYSSGLENGTSLQTANGANLTITISDDGDVFVNAARVVTPNVLVANGVVHIIDNVLNPNNTAAPAPDATSGAPGFSGTPAPEVPFTSGQPEPTTQINPTSEGAGPAATDATGSSSPTEGAAAPMKTGAVGMGALLGAGAAVFFL